MRLTSVLFLVGSIGLASPAFAGDDAARKEAEARFQEGLDLHDKGNDEQARLKFAQAYAMNTSPAILFALARSEQLSGKTMDAVTHFRAFLREPDHPKVTPDMRARARAYLGELANRVAQVKIEARQSAKISIDGKALDASLDEPVAVAPGRHVLEARAGDDEVERLEIEAVIGKTTAARFRTEEALAARNGQTSSWTTGKTATVVALSVAAAGAVAAGVGFFVGASNRADDVARLRLANPNCMGVASAGCKELSDAADARVQDRTLGWFFLGTGIAAGLGAVATTFLWHPETRELPKQGLVPVITTHGAALGVFGHF